MSQKIPHTGPLSPEFALLGFLQSGPSHGYELHQKLVTDLGQVWHVSLSQVYNILNRLESQEFITAQVHEQDKLPARRLFYLAPAGDEHFERWLNATSNTSVRLIRLEFLTRLYFARNRSLALTHQLIDRQLAEIHTGLEHLGKLALEIPPDQLINRLSIDVRNRQLVSIVDWLEDCHKIVDEQSAKLPS